MLRVSEKEIEMSRIDDATMMAFNSQSMISNDVTIQSEASNFISVKSRKSRNRKSKSTSGTTAKGSARNKTRQPHF